MKSSGADIAYCLWTHGVDAATPVSNPDLYTDFRPGISDTIPGIRATLAAGRGSQGVVRRDTSADFIKTRDLLLRAEIYGNTLMAPIICLISTRNPI